MQHTHHGSRLILATAALVALLGSGCAWQSLEPGHRGLRFDPSSGLKHDVLPPGKHNLGWCFLRDCGRLDDFDVTYSTKHEAIKTSSQEGLALEMQLSVIFRPIVSELYELDSEVGANYYDEVIGPEFRSAARGVFARHSYTELAGKNEKLEDEIEQEVRRRIRGKHVEVASITLESVSYAPEIVNAVRQRIVGEQEALRQKAALENDALRQKLLLEQQTAQAQLKIQSLAAEQEMTIKRQTSEASLQAQLQLSNKKNERAIAEEDALLEKAKYEATILHAKAEAQSITILAKAHAEENRAATQAVSPLSVQIAAYEALGKLGGTNTTIMLGDFSRAPQFLFPPGLGLASYAAYGGAGGRAVTPAPK